MPEALKEIMEKYPLGSRLKAKAPDNIWVFDNGEGEVVGYVLYKGCFHAIAEWRGDTGIFWRREIDVDGNIWSVNSNYPEITTAKITEV